MGDFAAIEASPAVRIARPPTVQLVHPGAPAVEREKYPITPVGPQRDVLLHRRYLSASKDSAAQRFDHGSADPPLGKLLRQPVATIETNSTQSDPVNHFWICGAGYF
jgi:hypothetical protein